MRTSQQKGRLFIAWVKAFLEAKRAKRAGSLLREPAEADRQLKLNLGDKHEKRF